MKSFLCLLLVLLISLPGHSTLQEPDRLIYQGVTLLVGPDNAPSPIVDGKIISVENDGYNTGIIRGYIATWEIRNDSLFLMKIQNIRHQEVPLQEFYNNCDPSQGVFADWHSRRLLVKNGTMRIIFAVNIEKGIIDKDSWIGNYHFPNNPFGNWCYRDSLIHFSLQLQQVNKFGCKGSYTLFSSQDSGSEQIPWASSFSGSFFFEAISAQIEIMPSTQTYLHFYITGEDSLHFYRSPYRDDIQGFPGSGTLLRCPE